MNSKVGKKERNFCFENHLRHIVLYFTWCFSAFFPVLCDTWSSLSWKWNVLYEIKRDFFGFVVFVHVVLIFDSRNQKILQAKEWVFLRTGGQESFGFWWPKYNTTRGQNIPSRFSNSRIFTVPSLPEHETSQSSIEKLKYFFVLLDIVFEFKKT